jgi:hypothetical protein
LGIGDGGRTNLNDFFSDNVRKSVRTIHQAKFSKGILEGTMKHRARGRVDLAFSDKLIDRHV